MLHLTPLSRPRRLRPRPFVLAGLLVSPTLFAAGPGISPTAHHAWSETAGWLNFAATDGAVQVYADHLEGFVWAENLGWLRLGSYVGGGAHRYANASASDYGINRSGNQLSGYAWSESAGWINFAPTGSGVTLDPATGQFSGDAWGENIGWLRFAGTATDGAVYGVAAAPVAGVCGGAAGQQDLTAPPTANLCDDGASPAVAENATDYTWSCAGTNGGAPANCSATRLLPVAGVCGNAAGQQDLTAPPTANLCADGALPTVAENATDYTWSCAGNDSGATVACDATRHYRVSASAGANGRIAPAERLVTYKESARFDVEPNAGYVAQVEGCGGALMGNTYSTGPVSARCTVTASFALANVPPVAHALPLFGTVAPGAPLLAHYAYSDPNGDPENTGVSGSRFRWVISADASLASPGDNRPLASGATGGTTQAQTYLVQTADRGQTLFYCVTPVATVAPTTGAEACSPGFAIGDAGLVWHVQANANPSGDGRTWGTAFASPRDALAVARSGDQVWVAAGVYSPGAPGAPDASFVIPDGVAVYGGFVGNETALDERDWRGHRAILSGDLERNDQDSATCAGIRGVNSRHVVITGTAAPTVTLPAPAPVPATLDGFTIASGDAVAGGSDGFGGGWYNQAGAPTLTNLIFAGNRAGIDGGGMHSLGSPDLANVLFSGNCAGRQGGGFASAEGAPVLTNVSFSGNAAPLGGGAAFAGDATLVNALLWGDAHGELALSGSGTLDVAHSLIQGCGDSAHWNLACGLDGGGNRDADPLLVDPAHGDLRPGSASSPVRDAGDDLAAADLTADLAGMTRRLGAAVDIGAYEIDRLPASAAASVAGSAGDDLIEVLRGNTQVNGGAGDDIILNAVGRQTLSGGAGADVFVYRNLTERGDIVKDFVPGVDRIKVTDLLLKLGYTGNDPIGDGYLKIVRAGASVTVSVDPDAAGLAMAVPLALLNHLTDAIDADSFIPTP